MEKRNIAPEDQHEFLTWDRGRIRGKAVIGMLIMFFGGMYLLRELGLKIPRSMFHPSSFLIAIGIVVLVRHKFRKLFGYILIGIGIMLKLHGWYPEMINLRLIFPILIILFGAAMLYKARFGKKHGSHKWKDLANHPDFLGLTDIDISPDDFVDGVSIFGGVKRKVTSKKFRGADLFTIFGGTELNLMQADFENTAIIEMTTILGGIEIVVPAGWQVRTEVVTILGGIEDNRYQLPIQDQSEKVLILKGTCILGGVEIKSFSA